MSVAEDKPVKMGRKAKGDGHLRRAEILAAAETLFVRDGYQGATIRKIAQEVGLSSTALYMHFRDKNEILIEICERAFDQLRVLNEEIAAQPMTPDQRLREMLVGYIRFGLANPSAYLVVFERSLKIEPDKMIGLGDKVSAPFHAALQALAQETPLRCEPEEAIQVCWAACHGLVSLMINNPAMRWKGVPRDELIRDLVDTLVCGLRAERA